MPLDTLPQLDGIKPTVTFNGDYIMAVPVKFYDNKKYKNRGKSIFSGGRSDRFDALDEVVSLRWMFKTRRVKQYPRMFLAA